MATVKKVKKAQRGGCVSNMSGAQRQRYFQSAYGPSPLEKAGQAIKNVFTGGKTKEERQEARAQRKASRAAKKEAPAAKYGKSVVKKAQSGTKLTKAAQDKLTDDMAKSLDKASVLGKNYIAPSDSTKKKRPMGMNFDKKSFDKVPSLDKLKKKIENKKVAPKNMKNGGKAKKMMSGGKCKYGC